MKNNSYITELTSKTIDTLRFPLAFLVIVLHVPYLFPKPYELGVSILWNIINSNIARLAVPTFFLISGYLFFLKIIDFNISIYKNVIINKTRTLLIPYLFFSIITFLIKWTLQTMSLHDYFVSVGGIRLFIDCGVQHFTNWRGLEDWPGAFPINGALWYMRDLIFMVFFSPIFFHIIKFFKYTSLVFFLILYLLNISTGIPHVSAICMFSIGAFFSINKMDLVTEIRKIPLYISIPIAITMMVIQITFKNYDYLQFFVIFGIISLINITSHLIEKKIIHPSNILAKSSFFIYATHDNIIALLQKEDIYEFIYNKNFISQTSLTILMPILITSVLLLLFLFIKTYLKPIHNVIMGGRL